MKRQQKAFLVSAALLLVLLGCAGPPSRIQRAISTMNRHMPEYVAESNKALLGLGTEAHPHPDAERLTGVGDRLRDAMDALDRWANGEGQ